VRSLNSLTLGNELKKVEIVPAACDSVMLSFVDNDFCPVHGVCGSVLQCVCYGVCVAVCVLQGVLQSVL